MQRQIRRKWVALQAVLKFVLSGSWALGGLTNEWQRRLKSPEPGH